MAQVHAELHRLATEPESVKGQVQTLCNALRDPFVRTTVVMGSSQHDRRLNHKEAERHLPLQFGGNRVDYGDFAIRVEGYAAVLSWVGRRAVERSRQAGQVRERHDGDLGEKRYRDVPTAELSQGSRSSFVHAWRSGNPGAEDPQCRPRKRTPRLARSHTVVQTPISGRTGIVVRTGHITQAHEENERAPIRSHTLLSKRQSSQRPCQRE